MAKEPSAGDLKDRVEIQRLKPVPDGTDYGGWAADEANWESVGERWARVRELGGFELFHARQVVAETDATVDLRWTGGFEDIDARTRFKWVNRKNRVMNVLKVINPDGLRVWHLAYVKIPLV